MEAIETGNDKATMTAGLFPLGFIYGTPGALALDVDLAPLLARHERGDWGNLSDEDRAANNQGLADGDRLLSAYSLPGGHRLWIITEADRSRTTILLPEEY